MHGSAIVISLGCAQVDRLSTNGAEKHIGLFGLVHFRPIQRPPRYAHPTPLSVRYRTVAPTPVPVDPYRKLPADPLTKFRILRRPLNTSTRPNHANLKMALASEDQQNAAPNSIAQVARDAVGRIKRPTDVGCSYSMLSWNETRHSFGRSVANEYVAIQVVVRNLNEKQEFLLHDSQFAVDADINGSKGRYFSGRDKGLVQAVNRGGEPNTPRGFATNGLFAISAIMSTVQPIAMLDNFTGATAAFHAGGLPAFQRLFPDHQQDQLVAIGNLGFSATNNFRTLVPKSGSTTFMMFVPSKPYEEGWWVQECAYKNMQRPLDESDLSGTELAPIRKRPMKTINPYRSSALTLCGPAPSVRRPIARWSPGTRRAVPSTPNGRGAATAGGPQLPMPCSANFHSPSYPVSTSRKMH
jgi:hypothetical protein